MFEVCPLAKSPADAVFQAGQYAPYLARLMGRHAETFESLRSQALDLLFKDLLKRVEEIGALSDETEAMRALRETKQQAHLILSAADLSGQWLVMQITDAMTRYADAAARAAFRFALNAAGLNEAGIFLVALGKMGAHELNYSSDIDIAAFYDPDTFEAGARGPGNAAARIVQHMTRLLEQVTGDGYVLRTDLRLRPDPRSTPVAVSTRMAAHYYESVGQNWERMVWIKGRPFAGDLSCASDFLAELRSFVWRQHLDYWAINDIQSIKAMINAKTDRASFQSAGADVKLGVGGIREIEFFAQTQQLILGGRDKSLRARATLGALDALVMRYVVSPDTASTLNQAYKALRCVEHRVQMCQDQQTHTLPKDDEARLNIARLCGGSRLEDFDDGVREIRESVHTIYASLFDTDKSGVSKGQSGNLVFTGVDNDPGTVETLAYAGFKAPDHVIETVRHWHRGNTAATRSARGRELLTALLPDLLHDMGETGEADQAFANFSNFFENLPSGVQTLSMLQVEADLRRDLVATLALAPRLGARLGRKPALLEALLQRDLVSPPHIGADATFEDAMEAARLYVADRRFLIGHDLLHRRATAAQSAHEFSVLADWTINEMALAAAKECSERFGPPPGEWCVAALGRLGGQAMTASSDLDIMVIYDPADDAGQIWFTRFTQRLITALSAQTADGHLYEVDMRLRPSGRSGPVAVRLSSFERYHLEEAWTWEHMALTRLRCVTEYSDLGKRLECMTSHILSLSRQSDQLRNDIWNMRLRLAKEKPSKGLWDLKLGAGGLLDLEFIVQYGLLAQGRCETLTPYLPDAINRLEGAGWLECAEAETLRSGYTFLSSLQQIQRIALNTDVQPASISNGLKGRLQRAVKISGFAALETELAKQKKGIEALREAKLGKI